MREQIKDTPLVKEKKVGRDREKKLKEEKEEEEEVKSPASRIEPGPPDYEMFALPLCYNRSP